MNNLLTLTVQTLVEHCADRPESEQAAACDAALQFLVQNGFSLTALQALPKAVAREMRTRKKIVPARLSTPTGHAGAAAPRLVSALEKTLNARVDLTEQADPLLLGGATLAVGDERLDASLRGALKQLHSHLTI